MVTDLLPRLRDVNKGKYDCVIRANSFTWTSWTSPKASTHMNICCMYNKMNLNKHLNFMNEVQISEKQTKLTSLIAKKCVVFSVNNDDAILPVCWHMPSPWHSTHGYWILNLNYMYCAYTGISSIGKCGRFSWLLMCTIIWSYLLTYLTELPLLEYDQL